MIIDTKSRNSIENSLARYLGIDVLELYSHVCSASEKAKDDCFINDDVFKNEVLSIAESLNPQDDINEIYMYHLSRRLLSDTNDSSSDNLKSLLLSISPLSVFLNSHGITFVEECGHIQIIYNGKPIDLSNTSETDICYLRSRLGYTKGREDYCVNGFAFRDNLMKNSYTRDLYRCPEFIERLADFLGQDSIVEDYYNNSKYYCFHYKLKISDIIFDDNEHLKDGEKVDHFIVKLFERLREYMEVESRYLFDHNNPIIRLADNARISSGSLVDVEEISYDMID